MSMNLSAKLDELQRGDRQLDTTFALCEIRTQLQELTKSVESCQSEVSEVKRDMVAIKVLSSRFLASNSQGKPLTLPPPISTQFGTRKVELGEV